MHLATQHLLNPWLYWTTVDREPDLILATSQKWAQIWPDLFRLNLKALWRELSLSHTFSSYFLGPETPREEGCGCLVSPIWERTLKKSWACFLLSCCKRINRAKYHLGPGKQWGAGSHPAPVGFSDSGRADAPSLNTHGVFGVFIQLAAWLPHVVCGLEWDYLFSLLS